MDQNFMPELLNSVFQLLLLVLTGFIIPYVKNKVGIAKFEKTAIFTCSLVKSAEQIYGRGEGQKKLEYVINQLRAKGIKIDNSVLAQIESAVFQETKKYLNSQGNTPEDRITLNLNS